MENASEYAPLHIEDVTDTVRSHTSAHPPGAPQRTGDNLYSTQDIANRYPDIGVKEVTIRTRWFEWLLKVAPEPLLKKGGRYTDLAAALFDDFAQRVKREKMDSREWVRETYRRFSHEWGNAGVIDGELMPQEVGSALALIQTQGSSLQTSYEQELAEIEALVKQLGEVEDDFSEAELNKFKAQGALRGLKRFRVETQSEIGIYNAMRQKRMQGDGGQGGQP